MAVSETPKLLATSKLYFDHLLGIKEITSPTRTVNLCFKKCILLFVGASFTGSELVNLNSSTISNTHETT